MVENALLRDIFNIIVTGNVNNAYFPFSLLSVDSLGQLTTLFQLCFQSPGLLGVSTLHTLILIIQSRVGSIFIYLTTETIVGLRDSENPHIDCVI